MKTGLKVLATLLGEILQAQPKVPAMSPYPERRDYLDALGAYTTAIRVQEQRRHGTDDADPIWVRNMRRQTGTRSTRYEESSILGIDIPPTLSSEEWQKKYAPIFLPTTALGRQQQKNGVEQEITKQSQ